MSTVTDHRITWRYSKMDFTTMAIQWLKKSRMEPDAHADADDMRDLFCDCFPEIEEDGTVDRIDWEEVALANRRPSAYAAFKSYNGGGLE